MIPADMLHRAQARAAAPGNSLAEHVLRLVADDLSERKPKADIFIVFDLMDEGPATNIARDKDKMIGEAVWQDLPATGRKPRRARVAKGRRCASSSTRRCGLPRRWREIATMLAPNQS
jgi:hypothetical protein